MEEGPGDKFCAQVERAAALRVYRVGLTGGSGGILREHSDLCLVVPSGNTARIQEAHILIGHLLCDLVERSAVQAAERRATMTLER